METIRQITLRYRDVSRAFILPTVYYATRNAGISNLVGSMFGLGWVFEVINGQACSTTAEAISKPSRNCEKFQNYPAMPEFQGGLSVSGNGSTANAINPQAGQESHNSQVLKLRIQAILL
jgi:hypothetical protein